MYQFVFLRHGRSLADDEMKFEGRYDSPLTSTGEDQARSTADRFLSLGIQFDRIVTSPLARAFRTAEIINEKYSVPLIVEPLLIERDNGMIAGMRRSEAQKLFPLPEFDSPFRTTPGNTGETGVQEHSRGGMALSKLMESPPGNYLVVTHGGIGNAILRNLLGATYMVNGSGISFRLRDNGWVLVKYYEDKNHWQIQRME